MDKQNLEFCMGLYRVIHQQSLCGRTLKFWRIAKVLVSDANFIPSHGLNSASFNFFYRKLAMNMGMPCSVRSRWLSHRTLGTFCLAWGYKWKCSRRRKVKLWLDVALLCDISHHVNDLEFQTSRPTETHFSYVWGCQSRWNESGTISETCRKCKSVSLCLLSFSSLEFTSKYSVSKRPCCRNDWFVGWELSTYREHAPKSVQNPFSVEVSDVPENLQSKLIELQ
jgi:hypothetical protein